MALVPALVAVALACGVTPGAPDHDARFLSSEPARLRRVLGLGLVTGSLYFAGTLYWIADVLVAFGGLDRIIATAVTGLLVLFLALFPAVALLVTAVLLLRLGRRGLLAAPAVWVSSELARTYLLGGFPWVLLGYSQATTLPVAQLASLVGVYGVSGLVALVSAWLAYGALAAPGVRRRALIAATVPPLLVAAWGVARLERSALLEAGSPFRVGLIQGNVAQADKWDPTQGARILRDYLRMSEEAARRGAKLIIWPESATPFRFGEDPSGTASIRRLARETGAHLLFGSTQVVRASPLRIYNAAFMVRPDGRTASVYRKIHLVPFGEYVPFANLLFFARPLVESASAFSPGVEAVTMPVGDRLTSTAICYEVVYPSLIRRFVQAGSQLLTTITNDAWYGHSSAPHQHFEQASMRAIEQGRYLVRAANTGISGVVDPYGRVLAQSRIFEPASIVADVRFIEARTIYGMTGDLFAYAAAALTALLLGVAIGHTAKGRVDAGD